MSLLLQQTNNNNNNAVYTCCSQTRRSSSPTGNNCDCFRSMVSRCKGGSGRWSQLSNGVGGAGTIQTFSFADSKLGYLTAAKGALVVRVNSCRLQATKRRAATTRKTCAREAAATVADAGDGMTTPGCCSHIADETGNFTLVHRRSRHRSTYDSVLLKLP